MFFRKTEKKVLVVFWIRFQMKWLKSLWMTSALIQRQGMPSSLCDKRRNIVKGNNRKLGKITQIHINILSKINNQKKLKTLLMFEKAKKVNRIYHMLDNFSKIRPAQLFILLSVTLLKVLSSQVTIYPSLKIVRIS